MFDGRWRTSFEEGLKPVGANLRRTGITADHLTALGVVLAGAASIAIANGALRAGLLLLVAVHPARRARRRGGQGLGHRRPARRLLRLRVRPRHRRAAARRRRLVPLHHPPRSHRGAAARRARRRRCSSPTSGPRPSRSASTPRRPHGAGRADHRPRRRPPLRLRAHRRALDHAGAHAVHRRPAVREGVAAGVGAQARPHGQPLEGAAGRPPHRAGAGAGASAPAAASRCTGPAWTSSPRGTRPPRPSPARCPTRWPPAAPGCSGGSSAAWPPSAGPRSSATSAGSTPRSPAPGSAGSWTRPSRATPATTRSRSGCPGTSAEDLDAGLPGRRLRAPRRGPRRRPAAPSWRCPTSADGSGPGSG